MPLCGLLRFIILLGVLVVRPGLSRAESHGPYQWLNVKSFGAMGDGKADDTIAITTALTTAKMLAGSGAVFFPAGTYHYTKNIQVDGVAIYGEDMTKTILESTTSSFTSLRLTGDSPLISDLTIRTAQPITQRNTRMESNGLDVYQARNFVITRVAIGPVSGAGIAVRESGGTPDQPAVIRDCKIENTSADGIHVTSRSQHIDILNNTVSDTGDDLIAVVSNRFNADYCRDIHIRYNNVNGQSHGRGISVVGGKDVVIESNFIGRTTGAGIYIASEASYDTYGADHISILNNTLTDVASTVALGQGAIHLSGRANPATDDDSLEIKSITISGNHIKGAGRTGLYIGSYTRGIAVEGNKIFNASSNGIVIGSKAADVSIGSASTGSLPNIIQSCGEYGIWVDPAGSKGALRISGVLFIAVNTKKLGHVDVISIAKNGTFASIHLSDNRLEQPEGLAVERLIEAQSPVTEAVRNTANINLRSYSKK